MTSSFSANDLPKRFDYTDAQKRIYASWEARELFAARPGTGRKPFTIVIPPPNVTGALHLGHALNNTLQDVLIRMKRMQGFETLWMPGTDHAGIATQAVVERRLKEEEQKTRHDLGREKLVERIWAWKDQYEQRIISQLKQMGCSCDWQRTRFTLDETCARAVRTTFFDLFRKQLIYRGKRLVNWDSFLQTAVSDDEVFHEMVKGHFWHFHYPVIDPLPGEPDRVTVATTRPETMLGDTAVAVHPDPAAALDRVEKELQQRRAVAPERERELIEQQLENITERRSSMLPALEQLRDMANDGRQVLLPLMERPIPLIADEWAKPELGTGCVKITPAHDANDYDVGQRQQLPMINILEKDGQLNANAGAYQGLSTTEARTQVVADLDQQGLLGEVEDREIDLAHSDRSKTPIEPLLADQWFVKMDELAQLAMDAVTDRRVQIFPERYAKGYLDWLGEKRDWPVSRQLWWGHRIPIWSCSCTDGSELEDLQQWLASLPADLVFQLELTSEQNELTRVSEVVEDGSEVHATVHVCLPEEDPELQHQLVERGFVQEEDVLDTWFSSALWPHSTLGWPESNEALDTFYPTSTLITSRDIITLWVARMVLMGLNNMEDVPFREVFIHPKILDGYGETMSKSKGNGVDPLDVIDKFGADALRFGLAYLTTETQDVRMPVQLECPHCQESMDQTRENRELPRVECDSCKQAFSTQWARSEEDLALPRGAVLSERFEIARNFCNKLWNASRFVLINLEGYQPAAVADEELAFEDRWLLSRMATVTGQVTESLEGYRFAEASRTLYDFAWDEFCSFYVEMAKARFQDDKAAPVARRVLAHALDQLLRLLHPVIPFITEGVWELLAAAAPRRGLDEPLQQSESIMTADWPVPDDSHRDVVIEEQFALFQQVLGAVREIRSRQGLSPRESIEFSVRCGDEVVDLLKPMDGFFVTMAGATSVGWGPDVAAPENNATVRVQDLEVFVDLMGLIDVDAEIERNQKLKERLSGQISGKEKKLGNQQFVDRAPAEVVERERESLEKIKQELALVEEALARLEKSE
ncbi:MAG: valine--tRNA ligase [Planctomycetota bacterium]|nr:valine--tRNA ligase [Planctomycetota bacterium]MEE2989389.1 valine--tRNA ligase [Planctomycetota bacterium]